MERALEAKAREAATAWSLRLRVEVTPDLVALGALFTVQQDDHDAVERFVLHLRHAAAA